VKKNDSNSTPLILENLWRRQKENEMRREENRLLLGGIGIGMIIACAALMVACATYELTKSIFSQ
jgi:hypothetical protein